MMQQKVLIIDDSKTFLLYIENILKQIPNVEVIKITDPLKALEVALQEVPDVVMTDFEMPGLLGSELCKIFRNHPKFMTTPIIMVTSNEGDKSLVRAIASGANDYLWKNSSEEVVLIKLRKLLDYQKLLKADVAKRELVAVHSVINRANHEFNNALCISNLHLNKLKKDLGENHSKELNKILMMNARMHSVVKKLNRIASVEVGDDSDTEEQNMIKL